MSNLDLKNTLSIKGRYWALKEASDDLTSVIMRQFNLPMIIAQILSTRELNPSEIETFLNPKDSDFPNPFLLKDMPKVADRIARAIINTENIGIMGDYDVDGATSSSILAIYLSKLGIKPHIFIPDRNDGYGPNIPKMQQWDKEGISLVITSDCGTSAFEAIDFWTSLGKDVIIIDHHEPALTLPNAYGIINPKRLDEDKDDPTHNMAAVGVMFWVLRAVNALLDKKYHFFDNQKKPFLKSFLDLVAFGTVCDVVPLNGINRWLVKTGLEQLRSTQNLGLKTLISLSDISGHITSYHLGYILGPRINAAGRIGQSDLGCKLLLSQNTFEAMQIAEKLADLNQERRNIEDDVLSQAIKQADELISQNKPFLLIRGQSWHQGVVGIIAGRLKDRYHLPTFVLSIENGEVKGSCRSIEGIDLGTIIIQAMDKKILTKGGGHKMAAGFSLNTDKIDDFEQFLFDQISPLIEGAKEKTKIKFIDAALDINGINQNLINDLKNLEPFGEANPEPIFLMQDISIVHTVSTRGGHIAMYLTGNGGQKVEAICFKAENTPMGDVILNHQRDDKFHFIGNLKETIYNGKTKIQFIVLDGIKAS